MDGEQQPSGADVDSAAAVDTETAARVAAAASGDVEVRLVRVPLEPFDLDARLALPHAPRGAVVVADGSSAATSHPDLRAWATALATRGFATLLVELMTAAEQPRRRARGSRRDVDFLAGRLVVAADYAAAAADERAGGG